MRERLRLLRRPFVAVPLAVVFGGTAAVLLALFQPWALFIDRVVDDAAPIAAQTTGTPTATPGSGLEPESGQTSPAADANSDPVVLASGSFISHEYSTTGTVVVLQFPSGERVLRMEDLDTSNGPDLHVWITDAPVIEGLAGWKVFDDGKYVSLGKLKGNKGSQNYDLPDSVNLDELTSISIWCKRFSVSFGAAELRLRASA
jgi:hypothetical protein